LEKTLQILDETIELVKNDAAYDGRRRQTLIKRLKLVKLVPLRMLVFNRTAYYDGAGEKSIVAAFCGLCDELGVDKVSEGAGGVIPENKTEYGYSASVLKSRYGF
jgi:hypothetical protein